MIKSWQKFLENKTEQIELQKYDYSKNAKTLTKEEIEDNFYGISKYNLYIGSIEVGFIDNNNNFRKDIKIGETLKKYLIIEIRTRFNSKSDQDTIKDIKSIIRKIKTISKLKYKEEYGDIKVIDPSIMEYSNIKEDMINQPDPFESISMDQTKFIYNLEDDPEYRSNSLKIFLEQTNETEISDILFYDFYDLHDKDNDYIDNNGEFWTRMEFREVIHIIHKDEDYVDRYYMPEDYYTDDWMDSDYTVVDIVDSISTENKEKYLNLILKNESDFIEILDICEEEYSDKEDLIENITDDDLKEILKNRHDEITNDIKSRYNDVYNDKCQVAIEEDIRTEICDYLDKYVECEYYLTIDDYIESIWIKFDPNIFLYTYDKDNDPEEWPEWSNYIAGESIKTIIKELLREHESEVSINRYATDRVYLDHNDINNYIKEVLSEYS